MKWFLRNIFIEIFFENSQYTDTSNSLQWKRRCWVNRLLLLFILALVHLYNKVTGPCGLYLICHHIYSPNLYLKHHMCVCIPVFLTKTFLRLEWHKKTEFAEGTYPPPFSNNPPFFDSPHFKKTLIPPFPILFFQTLNVVMLTASAKSWSMRGASHQPAAMVSCLTIRHACLPCLPNGRVSHCVPGFTEVKSCCYSRKWVWSSRTKLCCMASGK